MHSSGIDQLQTVFLILLTFVVLFALLAQWMRIPYPIVLVVAGLVLGFLPHVPRITLDPDLVFLVVLPPLLFQAAWATSWREFRFNLVSICLLAFGLVGFTVWAIASIAPAFFPEFDWQLGFVLGAVVATTDALAATSIAKRISLPRRIVDVLEGESLINDATGLLALEFALAVLVEHKRPTVMDGCLRLVWLTFGGLAIGLAVGFVVDQIERRIEDAPVEVVLSVLVSYATYLGAERVHASGVLAVVACGLFLSRRSAVFYSSNVRLQMSAVWSSLSFLLNGLVFVLIGLQLPAVLAGIEGLNRSRMLVYGAVFSALLILLRLCWVFPSVYLAHWVRSRFQHQHLEKPRRGEVFITGWTGMRGVVALAAAISLPATLPEGDAFPQRNLIVFLCFCVILVTLVLQGLSLPWLIRLLGLTSAASADPEELNAREVVLNAAMEYLEAVRKSADSEIQPILNDLEEQYRRRHATFNDESDQEEATRKGLEQYRNLSKELLRVERETAVRLRNRGQISDDVLRRLQHEFDLSETKLLLPDHA